MSDQKRIPANWSGMNLDAHLSRVEAGQYVDGRNFVLYVGKDKKAFIPRKFRGTKQIAFNAPAGVNTGIGTYWDETGDTLISFIHNDQGNHFILWMFPKEPTARVIEIPQLNLQIGKPVVGCAFINQELLIFTDGGDYPKCINLPRADDTNKKSIVRMYLPPSREIPTLDSRVLAVQLTLNGVAQSIAIPLAPANSQQLWDFQPQFSHFAGEFNGNTTLAAAFTAKSCAEFLEFEATQAGMWSLTGIVTDTINGVPQASIPAIVEYFNRYNNPFTDEQIRLERIVPTVPPLAVLGNDLARKTSMIRRKQMQFTYGYRLKDKDKTNTGPISDIALPSVSVCQNVSSDYNCVDVTFGDQWLNDPAMRGEIEFVDIYVRDSNDSSWFLVKSLEKYEWIYSRAYRYFNDESPSAADQAFVEAGNTYVPPVANALEALVDADDNARIVFGGITEGDPTPCVEIVPTPILDGSSIIARGNVSVHARIIITGAFDTGPNPKVYNINQPVIVYDNAVGPVYGGMSFGLAPGVEFYTPDPETWGQSLKLGGFLGYMAGTELSGISVQANIPAVVPGGQVAATPWTPPANSPAIGKGVFDGTIQGFSLVATNDTHRSAVRDLIEAQQVYSDLTIDGLERGKTYVLRIASNLCDRLGGAGGIYDIDAPGLAWQRTSARVIQVGSVVDPNIKIGNYECTINVPLTGPTVIEIGNIVIADTTNPNAVLGSTVLDGYLFDNLGNDYAINSDIRQIGVPAERQMVRFLNFTPTGYGNFPTPTIGFLGLSLFLWPALAPTILYTNFYLNMFGGLAGSDDKHTYSDHNGYWFFFNRNDVLDHPRAAWLSITGNPATPSGTITGVGSLNYIISNDFTGAIGNKWEGGLEGALVSVSGNLFNGGGWKQYIFANLYSGTNMRTHIKARFLSGNNAPIQGVTALLEGGRYVTSRPDGTIDLVAFGDVETNMNNRGYFTSGLVRDRLIFFFNGPCAVTFTGGDIRIVTIYSFQSGGNYSESPAIYHYNIGDVAATLSAFSQRSFGRGGTYRFGYYLKRSNGDRTPVKWVDDIHFPILTENLHDWDPLTYTNPFEFSSGVGRIDWALNGDVPFPWIGRWEAMQLVVTDDTTRVWMLQWLASDVIYSTIWDETTDEPTATSFASGNATEIYISLTDSLDRYGQIHTGALINQLRPNVGYLWEAGDMLRVLTYSSGVPMNGIVVDVEITGQRGQWITIAYSSTIPELRGGELIEIYRPRKPVDGDIATYYDLPNGLITIVSPKSATPTWSATTGRLEWGDTWLLPTTVPILPDDTQPWVSVNVVRESKWQSDFYASQGWGKGKPWFQDPDAATQDRGVLMRYTDSYKPGTNINGLNFVNGINFRIVENWVGPIRKMERIGDVIFVVCENGAFSVYVAIEQLQTTPDAVVQTAGGILGTIRPFAHKFGCIDPMTVVRATTNIMYFSRATGAMVQYNSNQLQDLAEQNDCSTYFQDKATTVSSDTKICGGYDMIHKEVIFSFGPHI